MSTLSVSTPNVCTSSADPQENKTPLKRHSIRGEFNELVKSTKEAVPLLGNVAVTGQNTVIYAAQNTGKTLLTLKLLSESIQAGRVSGNNVYYINVDDNSSGVLEKLAFAEKIGFEMLAEGYKDFTAGKLTNLLLEMIDGDKAKDQVVILDTLKKFVDLMNKKDSSAFANWLRRFNMKGGTVIALAHTNKARTDAGKLQYGGTNDVISDFDCGLILDEAGIDRVTGRRLVTFENIKRRGGGVVEKATYWYSRDSKITYEELLDSVDEISQVEAERLDRLRETENDEDIISVISDCILMGKADRTMLIKEARGLSGLSRQKVIDVLDKYEDPKLGTPLWKFIKGERSKKTYSLISKPSLSHPDF